MSKDSRKDSDKDRRMPILEDGNDTLQRVEVITASGRRRRWTADAKAAIVAESFTSGASVSAVSRRHDISPSLLFLWRGQAVQRTVSSKADGGALPGFVPVSITGGSGKSPSCEEKPVIEIELGAVRIRVRGIVDRRALQEVLAVIGVAC